MQRLRDRQESMLGHEKGQIEQRDRRKATVWRGRRLSPRASYSILKAVEQSLRGAGTPERGRSIIRCELEKYP